MLKKLVVVTGEGCPLCIQQKALLNREEIPFKEVKVGSIDPADYNIRSLPTLLVLDGRTVVAREAGFKTLDEVKDMLNEE